MATLLDLALIANDVYENVNSGPLNNYKRILQQKNGMDFFGAAYKGGEEGVIAFRGTDKIGRTDRDADLDIGFGKLPMDQLGDAFHFFTAARKKLSGCKKLIVTGHSLGGGLTQLVAARITKFAVKGVTFNAPGMANLHGGKIPLENHLNIFNYRAERDPVSLIGAHIGSYPMIIGHGWHSMDKLLLDISKSQYRGLRF